MVSLVSTAGRFGKTTVVANAYYSKCHLMKISYQYVEYASAANSDEISVASTEQPALSVASVTDVFST